ncbi:MAG TPA: hypothetical protein DCE78_05055 [Bacteroidetes bacterium]|nr:hypothetical protein [Bacteroidota bacterium]
MLTHTGKLASFFIVVISLIPHAIFSQQADNLKFINSEKIVYITHYQGIGQQIALTEFETSAGFNFNEIILNPYQVQDVKTDSVPNPKSVLYKSLIVPGWGQVVNKQAWKVPIIYGLLAGVTTYTVYAHNRYNGYKAAYYNSFSENTDLKFGPTPDFVSLGQPPELYRTNRNNFRNRRDMAIIGIVLAYGLNVVDAYIFAQLRDFDVSDNLSGAVDVNTDYFAGVSYPNLNITLKF